MVFSARRVLLAVLLVIAALIWVKINHDVEGRVWLTLTQNHGVTTADFLSVIAVLMAVVIAWPTRRAPEPTQVARPVAPPPGVSPWQAGHGTSGPSGSPPAAPGPPPGTTAGPARR